MLPESGPLALVESSLELGLGSLQRLTELRATQLQRSHRANERVDEVLAQQLPLCWLPLRQSALARALAATRTPT